MVSEADCIPSFISSNSRDLKMRVFEEIFPVLVKFMRYYIEFGSKTLSAAHIIVVEIVYFVKHLQCFLQCHNCKTEKSKRDLIMFLTFGLLLSGK